MDKPITCMNVHMAAKDVNCTFVCPACQGRAIVLPLNEALTNGAACPDCGEQMVISEDEDAVRVPVARAFMYHS